MELEKLVESLQNEKDGYVKAIQEMDSKLKMYESYFPEPKDATLIVESVSTLCESMGVKTLAEVGTKFASLTESLAKYEELGTTESIHEAFDSVEKLVENLVDYSKLGSKEEITECFSMLETYSDLATPSEIEKMISIIEGSIIEKSARKLALAYNVEESLVKDLYSKTSDETIVESLLRAVTGKKEDKLDEGKEKKVTPSTSMLRKIAGNIA